MGVHRRIDRMIGIALTILAFVWLYTCGTVLVLAMAKDEPGSKWKHLTWPIGVTFVTLPYAINEAYRTKPKHYTVIGMLVLGSFLVECFLALILFVCWVVS
jgi:hypothetical protein